VTWESGIPRKMMDNNTVYYVNVTHGALANDARLFKGISDILANGYTALLGKTRPAVRGSERLFRTQEQQDFDVSPEGIEKTILGLGIEEPLTVSEAPVRVLISHGDLRYASYPVLAGHFKNDGILYAEKAIDWNLKGALTERHRLALYPGDIGSSEVLISGEPDFAGAVIVGLGKFGELTAFQLTQTVEQGVAKYLLDVNGKIARSHSPKEAGSMGISSLIIGCGYGGLTVENSVRAVLQGVQNANQKIRKLNAGNAKIIEAIELIELYEDTALSCFYTLRKIEKEENKPLNIIADGKKIKSLFGSRRRLSADVTEGWWNRITVQQVKKAEFDGDIRCMQFMASTGGAREEQRELYSSTAITDELVEEISSSNRWSVERAKTIFELLIPNDFKEQLKRQGNINWILDKDTAAYPWELLQDTVSEARPLCVNAGMIRQLATQDYRLKINAVTNSNALVIGDPDLKGFVNQLPGAYEEAKMVAGLFNKNGFTASPILRGSPPQIIQALFAQDYKIIHLAGHGIFDEQPLEGNTKKTTLRSGMVIGKNVFLSTREISQMSTVPELVFVNCCYLGKTQGAAEVYYRGRYKLAANIGTQLIENGVKAVVVAGWAVDDAAALDFTKAFYEHMFEGDTFGDAVRKARRTIYDKYRTGNNTWGAYQCYGDPFYKFRSSEKSKTTAQHNFVITQQAEIELNNLHNEVETGNGVQHDFLEQLAAISEAVDEEGLRTAAITEKEAFIYADLYEYEFAIAKFESLLKMEKASFSVSSLEKYCNIRAKKYVQDFIKSKRNQKNLSGINKVIKDLQSLLLLSPTAERYSLIGSAYKRKGMLSMQQQKAKAYTEAALYYMRADTIQGSVNTLTNLYELVSILVLGGNLKWKEEVTLKAIANLKEEIYKLPSLEEAVTRLQKFSYSLNVPPDQMDYWEMIELANLKLCMAIVDPAVKDDKKVLDEVLQAYRKVWKKGGTKGKKVAETEHFELLLDGLSLISGRKANPQRKMLEQLKAESSFDIFSSL
ncbi:MAG: CHAT domain-containing protein, partial [Chitinophagaceae bacterium]